MKKLVKWITVLVGLLVLVVVGGSVALMLLVDEEMVAEQMESVLHRHVTIERLDIGLLSMVSGIEVGNVRVSNHKSPAALEALKGKPVAAGDLFAGIKLLNLKFRILPLFLLRVELNAFVLQEPVVNIVRYKSGKFNFSDLLEPGKAVEEKKAPVSKPEPEKRKPEPPKKEEPSGPLTADDIPLRIAVGKVGIERGNVTYTDRALGQTFEVYDLTLLAHSAEIDPARLESKNSVKIKLELGSRPKGKVRSGSVQSFDIKLTANGSVKPFDVKTRALDPEAALKVESPQGTLTGLQIFESVKSVKALEPYTGKLAFLKEEVKWNEGSVDVWYKSNKVKLSLGKIVTEDFTLHFEGTTNIKTKALDLDMGTILSEKENEAVKATINQNVKRQLRGDVAKYVPPEKITDLVMKQLVNKDGRIDLRFDVTGSLSSPRARLASPSVPGLPDLIKDAGGDIGSVMKGAAEKEAGKAINKGMDKLKKDFKF